VRAGKTAERGSEKLIVYYFESWLFHFNSLKASSSSPNTTGNISLLTGAILTALGAGKESPWYRISVGTCKKTDIPVVLGLLEDALRELK